VAKAHNPQMDLFGERAPEEPAHAVRSAPVTAALAETAKHLPEGVYLGTSSWHFPGWARLVYDHPADERLLAREGLVAYAQHPLLRCVGIDRTFYAPIPASEFRHYAEQVPAPFRFVVKAPMLCTAVSMRGEPGMRPALNPRFLDAAFAVERFVGPCLEGLGDKAGALVFQFPPVGREHTGKPQAFAERLVEFLGRLPHGPLYAVELRDPALITDAYLRALQGSGAHHCLGLHPRMPVASEQARATGLAHAGPLVVRWNLHQGFGYEEAKARYQPFTRLVDEDIPNRVSLARLCLDAVRRGQPAFVIANNKAEGSAPLTLFKLAEQIVTAAAHAKAERRSG
jgi:uncharacterized protein YecE (DUF72 family)